jgi:formate dehydrogenase iron-sulfur subunit
LLFGTLIAQYMGADIDKRDSQGACNMNKSISRRNFLRGGAAAAAGLAASSVVLPQAAMASTGDELCTVLDISKCIGCEACVDACREQWQDTVPDPVSPMPKPFPPRVPTQDWSKKKHVQDRLTPYNFLYVEMLSIKHKGEDVEVNLPRRCMHCVNPPCTNLCPFGAGRVEKNGIVHIDEEVCLGGAKCKKVCPWQVPQRQSGVGVYLDILPEYAGNGVMFKCHRCLPLVKEGKQPKCIEVCPEKVQSIGPRQSQIQKATALAKEKAKADGRSEGDWKEYVYGLDENGGTNTIYVSHVPVKELSEAIAADHAGRVGKGKGAGQGQGKGQGRGAGASMGANQGGQKRKAGAGGLMHLNPVANSMASEENLTWALVLAPIAGLAAGFTKLFGKKQPDVRSEKTRKNWTNVDKKDGDS